jgi:hydrogenase expression/formation protein HypE
MIATCPVPLISHPFVQMAHGGGGKLTSELVDRIFLPAFRNAALEALHDGALLHAGGQRLAFTTDSHVVSPLFFPGGDIGKLAVFGTANDLAMCGARPLWLSAGFILEEGLPIETLQRIAASMKEAAAEAGVEIVTGDTKVVDRGKGDGVFINTAGVGTIVGDGPAPAPHRIQTGDTILISGDVGRHGIAIMAVREGLAFESTIESDCASVAAPVLALLEAGLDVHCLRDLTRGGLATALVELAHSSRCELHIEQSAISVDEQVRGACEMLGLDPLYVANEGRFVCVLPANEADRALEILRRHPVSAGACRIGRAAAAGQERGEVVLKGTIGVDRVLDKLSGEQLPRIC